MTESSAFVRRPPHQNQLLSKAYPPTLRPIQPPLIAEISAVFRAVIVGGRLDSLLCRRSKVMDIRPPRRSQFEAGVFRTHKKVGVLEPTHSKILVKITDALENAPLNHETYTVDDTGAHDASHLGYKVASISW